MKLAANLSWLFKEEACLLKRIALAEKAGFKSIELAWPYQYTVSEFKAAVDASSVEVVLINTAPGDKEGDMGLAAVPGREEDFITGLKQAIEYAKAASCGNIHIMAGNVASGADRKHYRYRNELFTTELHLSKLKLDQQWYKTYAKLSFYWKKPVSWVIWSRLIPTFQLQIIFSIFLKKLYQ